MSCKQGLRPTSWQRGNIWQLHSIRESDDGYALFGASVFASVVRFIFLGPRNEMVSHVDRRFVVRPRCALDSSGLACGEITIREVYSR